PSLCDGDGPCFRRGRRGSCRSRSSKARNFSRSVAESRRIPCHALHGEEVFSGEVAELRHCPASRNKDSMMQVTETLNEGLKREIQVVVPAAEMEAKLLERLEDARGKIRLNGFRPGKVPVAHLRKMYG